MNKTHGDGIRNRKLERPVRCLPDIFVYEPNTIEFHIIQLTLAITRGNLAWHAPHNYTKHASVFRVECRHRWKHESYKKKRFRIPPTAFSVQSKWKSSYGVWFSHACTENSCARHKYILSSQKWSVAVSNNFGLHSATKWQFSAHCQHFFFVQTSPNARMESV